MINVSLVDLGYVFVIVLFCDKVFDNKKVAAIKTATF